MVEMSDFSAAAVEQFVSLGSRFGSDITAAQATKTLDSADTWGDVLKSYGLKETHVLQVAMAKERIEQLQTDRVDATLHRKQTSVEFAESLRHGKSLKNAGRTLLKNSEQDLFESKDPESTKPLQQVKAALSELSPVGYDRAELARQLDLIDRTLRLAAVQATLEDGGIEIIDQLAPTAERLRSALGAVHTTPRQGTPEHTRLLDFYDGLIVTRCRKIRSVARVASRMLGDPEIARAFELDHINPRRGASSPNDGSRAVSPPTPLPTQPTQPLPISDPAPVAGTSKLAPVAGRKTGTGEG